MSITRRLQRMLSNKRFKQLKLHKASSEQHNLLYSTFSLGAAILVGASVLTAPLATFAADKQVNGETINMPKQMFFADGSENSSLTVSNGSKITAFVAAGSDISTSYNNNTLTITDSTIKGSVAGSWFMIKDNGDKFLNASEDDVSRSDGTKVTITNSSIETVRMPIYGTIGGIFGGVYGALVNTGATNTSLTLNNSTITAEPTEILPGITMPGRNYIIGAYVEHLYDYKTAIGHVKDNVVVINGGKYTETDVFAAYATNVARRSNTNSVVEGNSVTLNNVTTGSMSASGVHLQTHAKTVNGNKVSLNNVNISGMGNTLIGAHLKNTSLRTTSVSNNTVEIYNSSFAGNIYGADDNSNRSEKIEGNKVTVVNSVVDGDILGSITCNSSSGGTVSLDASKANYVTGAKAEKDVRNASVTLTNSVIANGVLGGESRLRSVYGNSITINGGSVTNRVAGGAVTSYDGNANNNTVTISDATVGIVYGGHSQNVQAKYNTVTLNNVTVTGDVYGGLSSGNVAKFLTDDLVQGNKITINGGTYGSSLKSSTVGAGIANIDGKGTSYDVVTDNVITVNGKNAKDSKGNLLQVTSDADLTYAKLVAGRTGNGWGVARNGIFFNGWTGTVQAIEGAAYIKLTNIDLNSIIGSSNPNEVVKLITATDGINCNINGISVNDIKIGSSLNDTPDVDKYYVQVLQGTVAADLGGNGKAGYIGISNATKIMSGTYFDGKRVSYHGTESNGSLNLGNNINDVNANVVAGTYAFTGDATGSLTIDGGFTSTTKNLYGGYVQDTKAQAKNNVVTINSGAGDLTGYSIYGGNTLNTATENMNNTLLINEWVYDANGTNGQIGHLYNFDNVKINGGDISKLSNAADFINAPVSGASTTVLQAIMDQTTRDANYSYLGGADSVYARAEHEIYTYDSAKLDVVKGTDTTVTNVNLTVNGPAIVSGLLQKNAGDVVKGTSATATGALKTSEIPYGTPGSGTVLNTRTITGSYAMKGDLKDKLVDGKYSGSLTLDNGIYTSAIDQTLAVYGGYAVWGSVSDALLTVEQGEDYNLNQKYILAGANARENASNNIITIASATFGSNDVIYGALGNNNISGNTVNIGATDGTTNSIVLRGDVYAGAAKTNTSAVVSNNTINVYASNTLGTQDASFYGKTSVGTGSNNTLNVIGGSSWDVGKLSNFDIVNIQDVSWDGFVRQGGTYITVGNASANTGTVNITLDKSAFTNIDNYTFIKNWSTTNGSTVNIKLADGSVLDLDDSKIIQNNSYVTTGTSSAGLVKNTTTNNYDVALVNKETDGMYVAELDIYNTSGTPTVHKATASSLVLSNVATEAGNGKADNSTMVAGVYATGFDAADNSGSVDAENGKVMADSTALFAENSGTIYGGYAENGAVKNNNITVTGDSSTGFTGFNGTLYGGYSGNGTADTVVASGNSVTFGTDTTTYSGTFVGDVYGALVSVGDANANFVSLSAAKISGTEEDRARIYGAYTISGNAGDGTQSNANYVVAANSELKNVELIGAVTDEGTADYNYVRINGGKVTNAAVIGGMTNSGDATNNQVNVSGGALDSIDIYGALAYFGSTNNNTVNLTGENSPTIQAGEIYGASAMNEANTNQVNIDLGSVNYTLTAENIYGAESTGDAGLKGANKVNIGGANLTAQNIYGASGGDKSWYNEVNIAASDNASAAAVTAENIYGATAGEDATLNKVNVATVAAATVNAGNIYGAYSDGAADQNEVTLGGDKAAATVNANNIYGGYGISKANSNKVTIGGAASEKTSLKAGNIYGSYSETGSTDNNTLTINNAAVEYKDGEMLNIYGAFGAANALGNNVNITDSNVKTSADSTDEGGIYGGVSTSGSVYGNKINLINSTINANLFAGYSDGDAKVEKNIINISSGEVACDIYAGYSATGVVTDNVINLYGTTSTTSPAMSYADVSGAVLYGSNQGFGGNNTLNLDKWEGSVQGVANFDTINMNVNDYKVIDSSNIPTAHDYVLNITNAVDNDLANTKLNVTLANDLTPGQSLYLVSGNNVGAGSVVLNGNTLIEGEGIHVHDQIITNTNYVTAQSEIITNIGGGTDVGQISVEYSSESVVAGTYLGAADVYESGSEGNLVLGTDPEGGVDVDLKNATVVAGLYGAEINTEGYDENTGRYVYSLETQSASGGLVDIIGSPLLGDTTTDLTVYGGYSYSGDATDNTVQIRWAEAGTEMSNTNLVANFSLENVALVGGGSGNTDTSFTPTIEDNNLVVQNWIGTVGSLNMFNTVELEYQGLEYLVQELAPAGAIDVASGSKLVFVTAAAALETDGTPIDATTQAADAYLNGENTAFESYVIGENHVNVYQLASADGSKALDIDDTTISTTVKKNIITGLYIDAEGNKVTGTNNSYEEVGTDTNLTLGGAGITTTNADLIAGAYATNGGAVTTPATMTVAGSFTAVNAGNDLYGGYTEGGDVSNMNVVLNANPAASNMTTLYAGYSKDASGNAGTVSNNTVTINAQAPADMSALDLYARNSEATGDSNTLNINGWTGKLKSAQYFDDVNISNVSIAASNNPIVELVDASDNTGKITFMVNAEDSNLVQSTAKTGDFVIVKNWSNLDTSDVVVQAAEGSTLVTEGTMAKEFYVTTDGKVEGMLKQNAQGTYDAVLGINDGGVYVAQLVTPSVTTTHTNIVDEPAKQLIMSKVAGEVGSSISSDALVAGVYATEDQNITGAGLEADQAGLFTNNEGDVYAAYAERGNVDGSTVNVTSGMDGFAGNIFGGYIENGGTDTTPGSNNNNVVTVNIGDDNQQTMTADIYGAHALVATGTTHQVNVENNTINLKRGKIYGMQDGIFAAYTEAGAATSNTVTIDQTTIFSDIYAGYTELGAANNNKINFTTGIVTGNIYAGYTLQGDANENTVETGNFAILVGDVYGAYTYSGSASDNLVNFNGNATTSDNLDKGFIYGAYTYAGDVENNMVNIYSGASTYKMDVYGAYTEAGNASGNSVNIETMVDRTNIYGAYTAAGEASQNVVNLRDNAKVRGDVYAAYGTTTTNNTIIITDSANVENAALYGSNNVATGTNENNLILSNWTGAVKSVANFDNIEIGDVNALASGSAALNIVSALTDDLTNTTVKASYDYTNMDFGKTVILVQGNNAAAANVAINDTIITNAEGEFSTGFEKVQQSTSYVEVGDIMVRNYGQAADPNGQGEISLSTGDANILAGSYIDATGNVYTGSDGSGNLVLGSGGVTESTASYIAGTYARSGQSADSGAELIVNDGFTATKTDTIFGTYAENGIAKNATVTINGVPDGIKHIYAGANAGNTAGSVENNTIALSNTTPDLDGVNLYGSNLKANNNNNNLNIDGWTGSIESINNFDQVNVVNVVPNGTDPVLNINNATENTATFNMNLADASALDNTINYTLVDNWSTVDSSAIVITTDSGSLADNNAIQNNAYVAVGKWQGALVENASGSAYNVALTYDSAGIYAATVVGADGTTTSGTNVTNNTLSMNDLVAELGTTVPADDIVAGVYAAGDQAASGGTVLVDSANALTTGGSISGGYAERGDVTANTVNVTAGSDNFAGNIYGGYSENGGGSAGAGTNSNNTVNVDLGAGTITADIYGAYSANNDATGTANNNVNNNNVFINSGTVTGLESGIYGAFTEGGNATGNTVTTAAGTTVTSDIYGAATENGDVSGNKVVVNGTVNGNVVGGETAEGNATDNSVIISEGSVVDGNITGGISDNGTVSGNSVTTNGIVTGDILGGAAGGSGTATNNIVTANGNVTGNIIGATSTSGAITNNTVNVNGTVDGNVTAGSSDSGAISGNIINVAGNVTGNVSTGSTSGAISDNTINLNGDVTVGGITLAGNNEKLNINGNNTTVTGDVNMQGTGDTVNLNGYTTAANWYGANATYNFNVPENYDLSGDTALVTVSGNADISNAKINASIPAVLGANMNENSVISFFNANSLNAEGTTGSLTSGLVNFDMEFGVSEDGKSYQGKVTKAQVTPNAKNLAETRIARLTLLNAGSDMITTSAFSAMSEAIANNKSENEAGDSKEMLTKEMHLFTVIGASKLKAETGSHVDVNGWNFLIGFGKETTNKNGKLYFGPIVEYGRGDYDSYNDGGIHGEGNTSYIGAGIVAKQQNDDGVYYEGSLRAGRSKGDYKGNLPGVGRTSYDSDSTYVAAHLGVGKLRKLSEKQTLDIYGKLFWHHQQGESVSLGNYQQYDIDGTTSARARVGFRVNNQLAPKSKLYYGLAYQYELAGEVNSVYRLGGNAFAIDAPSVKGGSGLMEVGYSYNEHGPFSFDMSVNGAVGRTRGIGGKLQATWKF
ncbi:MAG: hypothetical protein Q4D21_08300 [Phascolarctobacterium sp.]|nr:hypothetical protein [Phascolarctobacterium sp.]